MFPLNSQHNRAVNREDNERLRAQMRELQQLYPGLTDPELKRAKENLDRYLELAFRIFIRAQLEEKQRSPLPDEPL